MSYLVLARKWRPRRFAELVGQQHVVRALVNGIETGRLHHAFLFTGTRGVGKTTIARILAKALNCEVGVSAEPCGVCSACKDIDAGRFVDLLEIDAASRTKVDDTRELLDNVIYAPSRGRYKVYLIDEVHMLSTHSFNALLKTLEEPPPHVKFLLATTDPQKLPVTVLSRCLQFSLKRLERAEIDGQMRHILTAEGVEYELPALAALARAADGSLRDALSLLDQALAFGNGSVRQDDVLAMLGTIDRRALAMLSQGLMSGDRGSVKVELKRIAELSVDYSGLLSELLVLWHDVAARQVLGDDVESELVDDEVLIGLAEGLTPEDVQLYYQLTLLARRDLDLAPDHRTGFEMAMLRLMAFRTAPVSTAPVASGSDRLPAPVKASGTSPAVAATLPARPAAVIAPRPPAVASTAAAQTVVAPTPAAVAARAAPATPQPAVPPTGVADTWFDLVGRAELRGPSRELAGQLKPIEGQGARWKLALAPNLDSLNSDFARRGLETALRAVVGSEVQLEIVARVLDGETMAERSARARSGVVAAAETELMADSGLQALTSELGARILPGSLQVD
jgi:DNA polymerase III subunit gamma/tau